MTHRILHLSDTHLTGDGIDEDGVDAAAALDRILHDARFVAGIDAIVVSGDIADDGSAAGCAAVRDRVGRFAASHGVPHVYCVGNHDRRDAFTAVFGTGHRGPDGEDAGRSSADEGTCAAVSDVTGLRMITLDSLVPGSVHGQLGQAQLAWLREILTDPAPAGSVVVLHHPPIALAASPWQPLVNLRDARQLGEILAGTDVRAVLCGHYHLQLSGSINGVPVWVTPGVVTRIDLTAPPHLERAVKGAAATVVDLDGTGSPMFHTLHARDPHAGEQVYLVDGLSGAAVDYEEPASTPGSPAR
jgi:Icc protein